MGTDSSRSLESSVTVSRGRESGKTTTWKCEKKEKVRRVGLEPTTR